MKAKLVILLATLSLSLSISAADTNKPVPVPKESKKSFFAPEGITVSPYYSVLSAEGFQFDSAAVGIETTFHVNKYIGITLDAFGKDDANGAAIDRAGLALTTTLPLNRKFALYGQGGFGYWTGDVDEFDMVMRIGLKYKFSRAISIATDIGMGTGISGDTDRSQGSYQQIRILGGLSF